MAHLGDGNGWLRRYVRGLHVHFVDHDRTCGTRSVLNLAGVDGLWHRFSRGQLVRWPSGRPYLGVWHTVRVAYDGSESYGVLFNVPTHDTGCDVFWCVLLI